MLKYLREYKFYIILFGFTLIPLVAIDTSSRSPRQYAFYDKAIVFITSPIQSAISFTLEKISSAYNNYVYLWHTRQENLSLLEENRKLLSTIASLRETQQENLRLRKLLNFEEQFSLKTIVSRVIARDISTEFRAIRINRGSRAGIERNMAVVTAEGIVGRVLRTTEDTADVVTIMDLLSAVDAVDERSRARGVIEGLTDDTCQVRFTNRTDDIQPGDIFLSSGLGSIFPKGIPVGVVSKVNKKRFGITQEVEIKPSVDFSRLEEVLIVTHWNGPASLAVHADRQDRTETLHADKRKSTE